MSVKYPVGIQEYALISRPITEADAGATVLLIHIPPRTLVRDVQLVITEGFVGGTPAIDVGDAAGVNTWIANTAVTEATPGVYEGTLAGKYYAGADRLTATLSGSLSNEMARVVARLLEAGELIG